MTPQFAFRPLVEADLARLHDWLRQPHVAEWWKGTPTIDELRADYMPTVPRDTDAVPYLAWLANKPAAFVQVYVAVETGDGWWPGQHDRGLRGIDLFIADPDNVGRGLGTALVRQFVEFVFQDPTAHRIQVDPSPENHRAIRCYEKAGFRRGATITTPDGPAVMLGIDRPAGGA